MTLARLYNNTFPWFPSLYNGLFEGDWLDWSSSNFSSTNTSLPAVNIMENNDTYVIEVAAPGMKKNDFKINYDNGLLTISSEKKEENKEDDNKYTRHEFSYQSFQRTFNISEDMVDNNKIEAKYTNGILHVALPKKEVGKLKPVKEIKIS